MKLIITFLCGTLCTGSFVADNCTVNFSNRDDVGNTIENDIHSYSYVDSTGNRHSFPVFDELHDIALMKSNIFLGIDNKIIDIFESFIYAIKNSQSPQLPAEAIKHIETFFEDMKRLRGSNVLHISGDMFFNMWPIEAFQEWINANAERSIDIRDKRTKRCFNCFKRK